jgi:SAM-dependent methyltransferase
MATPTTNTASISDAELSRVIHEVEASLPVVEYMGTSLDDAAGFAVRRIEKYLPRGSTILDFGSGPGDAAAVLAGLGYRMSATDDLCDEWHLAGNMRDRILRFMARWKVDFFLSEQGKPWPWAQGQFDMVMSHHVLEHLIDSPRELMVSLTALVRDGGYVYISVPSAVNIRKRISLLRGQTNHPPFDKYYWSEGTWRGHRREYCRDDLVQLAACLGLNIVELQTYHYMTYQLSPVVKKVYEAVTAIVPGWRDSWYLIAQRPAGWKAPQKQLRPLVRKVRPE